MSDVILKFSELTKKYYIVIGRKKYDVTSQISDLIDISYGQGWAAACNHIDKIQRGIDKKK